MDVLSGILLGNHPLERRADLQAEAMSRQAASTVEKATGQGCCKMAYIVETHCIAMYRLHNNDTSYHVITHSAALCHAYPTPRLPAA